MYEIQLSHWYDHNPICSKNPGNNLPCIEQNNLRCFPVVLQTNKASLHPALLLFDLLLGYQFDEDESGVFPAIASLENTINNPPVNCNHNFLYKSA